MAKAHLTLPGGTTANIEGTAEEVATLLARFSGPTTAAAPAGKPSRKKHLVELRPKIRKQGAKGLRPS